MHLEGGFKRGGRIRVAECLRQFIPNKWDSVRKRSFTKCFFCVYTRGYKGSYVGWIVIVLLGYRVEGDRTDKLKWGDAPEMELKQTVEILYWMRCVIGIHSRVSRIGSMWSDYLALHTGLAAALWTLGRLSTDRLIRRLAWSRKTDDNLGPIRYFAVINSLGG